MIKIQYHFFRFSEPHQNLSQYAVDSFHFSFIITKKECHFAGLIQGREEHVKNIKLSWRRRTIIFVMNCKQKLILTAKMKSRSGSWNVNVFVVNKKSKLLTVR